MKNVIRRGVVAALAALFVVVVGAGAARAENQAELDKRLHEQLQQTAPDAVAIWDAANRATERGDWDAAVTGFRKVTELAPQFDAAFRRMSWALESLGKHDEAKAAAQHALDVAGSPLDRAALAKLLMVGPDPAEQQRGQELARQAADQDPDDGFVLGVKCDALAMTGPDEELEGCVWRALALDPDDPHANAMGALVASALGHTDEALEHLEHARAGLTEQGYAQLRAQIEANRPEPGLLAQVGRIALYVLAAWAAGLFLIFLVGVILSHVTLRAIERSAAAGADGGGQHGLRAVYRAVIAVASVYFYLSIPIVLLGVLAAGVGVIGGILAAGWIAPKLFILIVIVVGATFLAVLRGLFARRLRDEPGERLDLAAQPALRAALDEVASVVGTRPVDAVYLVPGCTVAVSEHRAGRGRRPERRFILGVGVLDGMKKGWFKSILAHEHGHFRNQDTAGGTGALAVRRSLVLIMVRLAQSGAATKYNPAWLFVRLYHGLFLRVSQGASRLQEVLADRWAARAYGSAVFEAGFRHVVERDATFELQADYNLSDAINSKRPLANLYDHEPSKPFTGEGVADAIARVMDRPPAAYDSHPAPRQRLAWVAALAAPPRANPDDDEPAWSLFADRAAIELRMTDVVRDNVERKHRVRIAKPAPAAPVPAPQDPEPPLAA